MLMMKVLIVDDDINVVKCLRQLIDWDELECEIVGEAYDGDSAYKEALEKKPDVIISDIKMPFSDGTVLCKKVRESMCNVEIIFLSAYEDFSAAQIALKYGVKEYILKPIDMRKIKILSEILRQIKANMEQRNSFERLLSGTDTDAGIFNALKNSDTRYFEELFGTLIGNGSGDFAIIRMLCQKLINVLYDYFQLIGVSNTIINKRRQSIENDMENLKMVRDMVFYTRKLYFDVMQFENDNRDEYHKSLVTDIKNFIHENYTEKFFNVSFVAQNFNFSIDYIGKLFKQYTGTAISNYVTDVRLKKAVVLLRDTMLSVNEIADIVGYSSSGYFIKVFKAVENMTPMEYRIKVKLNLQKLSDMKKDF